MVSYIEHFNLPRITKYINSYFKYVIIKYIEYRNMYLIAVKINKMKFYCKIIIVFLIQSFHNYNKIHIDLCKLVYFLQIHCAIKNR